MITKELKNSNISLQEAYQQLQENEKIQRDFINVAAHELRTPIQPILGLSGILHSELRNPSQREILEVVVTISDTGKGIDSDIIPRLFSKFVSKSDAGTGLGLFISKNIIESHGGKMWAANNSNGVGAIFSFTLFDINFDSTSYRPSGEDFTQN